MQVFLLSVSHTLFTVNIMYYVFACDHSIISLMDLKFLLISLGKNVMVLHFRDPEVLDVGVHELLPRLFKQPTAISN